MTLAEELKLKPQARKILAHLKHGLSISPREAQDVYQVPRLAASIHEIRKAGYKVRGVMKRDMMGHGYMRYSLLTA